MKITTIVLNLLAFGCYWIVLTLSEIEQLSWQWFVIAGALVVINVIGYIEGRIK